MPHPNEPVAVWDPDGEFYVILDPAVDYPPDDPIVKRHPQYFVAKPAGGVIESVAIEQATAAPGEKRRPGRPKKA